MINNWFIFLCGILQLGGAIYYIANNSPKLGALYILYSLTNFILGMGKTI